MNTETIPDCPNDTRAQLVWNHETHHICYPNQKPPAELFVFQDGTDALGSITVAHADNGTWRCVTCGNEHTSTPCPCGIENDTNDPF